MATKIGISTTYRCVAKECKIRKSEQIGIYLLGLKLSQIQWKVRNECQVTRPKMTERLWPGQPIPEATNILFSFLCLLKLSVYDGQETPCPKIRRGATAFQLTLNGTASSLRRAARVSGEGADQLHGAALSPVTSRQSAGPAAARRRRRADSPPALRRRPAWEIAVCA